MMKPKFDAAGINSRTERTYNRLNSQIEFVNNCTRDSKKEQRLSKQLCTICFHTTRICGQGFTKFTCQMCEIEDNWHNTCVPALCLACAENEKLCQNCGADINLERR
jgi:hypothetical protein